MQCDTGPHFVLHNTTFVIQLRHGEWTTLPSHVGRLVLERTNTCDWAKALASFRDPANRPALGGCGSKICTQNGTLVIQPAVPGDLVLTHQVKLIEVVHDMAGVRQPAAYMHICRARSLGVGSGGWLPLSKSASKTRGASSTEVIFPFCLFLPFVLFSVSQTVPRLPPCSQASEEMWHATEASDKICRISLRETQPSTFPTAASALGHLGLARLSHASRTPLARLPHALHWIG